MEPSPIFGTRAGQLTIGVTLDFGGSISPDADIARHSATDQQKEVKIRSKAGGGGKPCCHYHDLAKVCSRPADFFSAIG